MTRKNMKITMSGNHKYLFHRAKTIALLLILSAFCFSSCRQKKEAITSDEPKDLSSNAIQATANPKDTFPEKSRLVIAFFSVADGVDFQAILRFEDSIGEYAGEKGINIDYEKTHWGREGETDFCLELTELSPEEQAEFIERSRELLKSAQHVKIYENAPCRHRRSR